MKTRIIFLLFILLTLLIYGCNLEIGKKINLYGEPKSLPSNIEDFGELPDEPMGLPGDIGIPPLVFISGI